MLKKYLIITLILVINCKDVYCTVKDELFFDIYTPITNIRDLVFEVYSKQIEQLVAQKVVTTKVKDIKLKFYWNNNNFAIEIVNGNKIDPTIQHVLIKEHESIIKIITGSSFDQFVQGYDYKKTNQAAHSWVDPTGLKEIKEILIVKDKDLIAITQKKNQGQSVTQLYFKKLPWSGDKKVLVRAEKLTQKNLQSIKVETRLEYFEKRNYWLPKTMTVRTKHLLQQEKESPYNRTFETKYNFQNYQINTADALRWFSTR